jgi:tRNA (cmo5U34)-methyltransferase
MDHSHDTNAAIWHSGEAVQAWAAEAQAQERHRVEHRRFLAALLPFGPQETFTFLDLGAGTGAASRTILDMYPGSTAILADFSGEMMRAGEREMQPYSERYRYVEFDMAAGGGWPAAIPAALDAVVTSMCVHHLPDERKQGLFTEIFDRLAPGGWYLNYDAVAAGDPVVEATWQRVNDDDNPEAAAKRMHRTPLEKARWDNHVRYIVPLGPQLEYLTSAGFEGVDVYWKQLGTVIYGGRRPG